LLTALAGLTLTLPAAGLFKQDPETINSWYERLATALNKLPNSFPRTKSNIEITLLKKIFLPEEAKLAGIGCGLCVTGCPSNVARLEPKTEGDIVNPPKDFAAWEHERLVNRGLA